MLRTTSRNVLELRRCRRHRSFVNMVCGDEDKIW